MANCARCGVTTDERPANSDYSYCQDCLDRFERARENGVLVRYYVNAAGTMPEGYYVSGPSGDGGYAGSQTKALARAKKMMEKINVEGVFEYRPTQSQWLIDEYLEVHPGIAEDVEKENQGFFSRLFG